MTLDPQHVAEHNLMIANLHAQCARFGLTPTSGGPYTVGDPDHIGEHGRYLDDLLTIEITAGRTFTKPIPNTNPVHGQTGHITDHEDLNAWIQEASTWPAWNDASGGTITEIDDYNSTGERWRLHVFDTTAGGTLTVTKATQPFRVLVVGGGQGGYGHGINGAQGDPGGSGGHTTDTTLALTAGDHTVTVGAHGRGGNSSTDAYGAIKQYAGELGTLSEFAGISTGSQAAGGGQGSAGTDGVLSDITGAATHYGGGGGGGGTATGDGWSGTPGGAGGAGGGGNGAPGGGGNPSAVAGQHQYGGGGGGGGGNNGTGGIGAQGGHGGSGVVVVAYRIG